MYLKHALELQAYAKQALGETMNIHDAHGEIGNRSEQVTEGDRYVTFRDFEFYAYLPALYHLQAAKMTAHPQTQFMLY